MSPPSRRPDAGTDAAPTVPVAVIGLAVRLPGAGSVAALRDLLASGRTAVGPIPAGRWTDLDARAREERPELRHGAFLDGIDGFDAALFGVAPREAAALDPQHRLALELCWEALEDAGLPVDDPDRPGAAVVLGTMAAEYERVVRAQDDPALARYALTGTHRAGLANRVSYLLGLGGRSLTVDSAQSSALVAVQLACEALARTGGIALAGGVDLNLLGATTREVADLGALSPSGRCATLDDAADGYVRGEGGAVVVLKPLAAAERAGDRILAVVAGGAIGHDAGGAGYTVPARAAQERVLRAAHAAAGTDPAGVAFVELHGTGTRAGDPVEAAALGAVVGRAPGRAAPVAVGSVKTVVGHLEGAAGAAGLAAAVLALADRRLPATLHPDPPSVDLDALGLHAPAAPTPLPDGPLTAGVSAFGMGGTHCHLVLASAPAAAPAAEPQPGVGGGGTALVLSAHDPAALAASAGRLADHLDTGADARRVAAALVTTRPALAHRAVVHGAPAELPGALRALAAGRRDPRVATGAAAGGGTALLFPGQGAQRPGMGLALAREVPAFAAALDAIAAELDGRLGVGLHDLLAGDLDDTGRAQPALLAVELALARTLEAHGVTADVLIGHSVGGIAAACHAGVLSTADAAALVTARARLMAALPAGGAMAAVEASEAEVRAVLAERPAAVEVAAVNGPAAVVLSGDADAVEAAAAAVAARGRRTSRLRVSHAFHSARVEPVLEELARVAAGLSYREPRIPVVSDLTGALAGPGLLTDPRYWVRHAREAVRFGDGVAALRAAGAARCVEVGPGAALTGLVQAAPAGEAPACVPALRDPAAGGDGYRAALARLHSAGGAVDWRAVLGSGRDPLPGYPFQRRRYWAGEALPRDRDTGAAGVPQPAPPAPDARPAAARPGPARPAPSGRPAGLLDAVRAATALVLGHPDPAAVAVDRTFRELGLDSLGAVELRDELAAATGRSVPATATYDHPTPRALAAHLADADADAGPATAAVAVAGRPDPAEPIAIVGAACRLPGGVTSPEELWALVRDGRDGTGPFPPDRDWPGEGRGGFVDAAGFDAAFFGISPREAAAMDPQQRLVLESCWEACERAGIDPAGLRGSDTGVYMGVSGQDYLDRLADVGEEHRGHALTGGAAGLVAGRVAHVLGLRGPALAVDTACSSSLVALHSAVQALRRGECDLALAGGVAVMATPGMFTEFARQGGLAADGRCKAFADAADGTGWAEGVAVLVVERLSDARARGHEVLAVVRGSAVGSDGASNGLTAPSGPAQQQVIARALADAGLRPGEVDVLEAHGTGTRLGDPIEAHAVLDVYGRDRVEPLLMGSLKSNTGHTQAAAGAAGVVKLVEALRRGEVPATLHVDAPSRHVEWERGGVELVTAHRAWPVTGRPRRAAVSSFGISGTNAHVVLEQAPPPPPPAPGAAGPEAGDAPDGAGGPAVWPLSAADGDGLRRLAAGIADAVDGTRAADPRDVAAALARSRTGLDHRAAVVGRDRAELVAGLRAVAATGAPARPGGGELACVLPGQGAQRPGMGLELAARFPVFARALDEVCAELDAGLPRPLREVLAEPGGAALGSTAVTQPALFAHEVALFRLLESWGVVPDRLLGHSVGGITAAYLAGVWSLPDACRLVVARGRLLGSLPAGGAMLSVGASRERVAPLLTSGVVVAAVNAPDAVVVSGVVGEVAALERVLAAEGVRCRRLAVSHAFHSPLVEPVLGEFAAVARSLVYRRPERVVVSDVTGAEAGEELCDPGYWVAQVREPVRFADGVAALVAAGVGRVVEVGPDAVLVPAVVAGASGVRAVALQRRDRPQVEALLEGVGRLWCDGAVVDWSAVVAEPGWVPRSVVLPVYPFHRTRHWAPSRRAAGPAPGERAAGLLHRVRWEPLAAPPPALAGRWAVLVPAGTGGAAVDAAVTALAARGAEPAVVALPADPGRAAVADLVARVERPAGVLALPGPGPVEDALWHAVTVLQGLADAAVAAPAWLLAAGEAAAGVAGVGRVAALERGPDWGGVVELAGPDPVAAVRAAVTGAVGGDEPDVRVEDGRPLARRLVRAAPTRTAPPDLTGATVLVTGGGGALGHHLARRLAERGAARVVLAARRPGAAPDLGATACTTAALDVTDAAAVTALVRRLAAQDPPLRGVVHAAGVLDDALLTATDRERFTRVLAPKLAGARALHDAVDGLALDLFVLVTSLVGVLGNGGQVAYAAANAAADALAEARRAAGLPGTALAFGPWAGPGMAEGTAAAFARTGIRPLDPERALDALDLAGAGSTLVADVDWDALAAAPGRARQRAQLAALTTAPPPAADDGAAARLAGLPPAERHRVLLELVRTRAAAVLGHPDPARIAPDRTFRELGVDSLTAVELRAALAAATGAPVSPTVVFDHPTPAACATHLLDLLAPTADPADGDRPAAVPDGDPGGDPVVVVGTACRLPGGVTSPEELWALVRDGRDGTGPLPADRGWDPAVTGRGGFVDAAGFDAAFFGISPREAAAMNPQQRLVLESCWQALERAGIDPTGLRGSATGVFVGVSGQDYGPRMDAPSTGTEGFLLTGSAPSVVSGRVSYTLGLEGPSVSVDTACSSSLVALHSAVQALRRGECDLALAGGVTVMATAGTQREFARQGGLAADGRCKAFADAADGTGWAEGVAVLVVERLSDARARGHEVLAVVRGSAVGSDGASNGLTAPNGPAQQRVIRRALADAGLRPGEVDVLEAHGTGTRLGDPIEAHAVLDAYGRDRAEPLLMGSLKSNTGHTQAAAGAAGVLKVVEALRRGEVPATLHVDTPTRHVDWSSGAVELVTAHREWPVTGRPRRAAVSSFGISGTNAHVVLEQAPPAPDGDPGPADAAGGPVVWPLSAPDGEGLRRLAAAVADAVDATAGADPRDVAAALARSRTGLPARGWALGRDRDELVAGLRALAAPADAAGGGLACVFSGQGAQQPGMGAALARRFPVFRAALDEVLDACGPDVRAGLADERVHGTAVTQPALFAHEVALFRLLESFGIVPDRLLGHSVGGITAAYLAGVWSLPDACRLVVARGRLLGSLPAGGAMLSVRAPRERVEPLLTPGVVVAAVNAPDAVVVSGVAGEVGALERALTADGVRCRRLAVSHAFHSPLVEPVLGEFAAVARSLGYRRPERVVVSDVTGVEAGEELCDPEYWVAQVREPVRFADGVAALVAAGVGRVVEVGPDAVLTPAVVAGAPGVRVVALQRRDRSQVEALLEGVGRLWRDGAGVDWSRVVGEPGRVPRPVVLPTYPFHRTRHWLDDRAGTGDGHPLAAREPVATADGALVAEYALDLAARPELTHPRSDGAVLLRTGVLAELALDAGHRADRPVLDVLAPERAAVADPDAVLAAQVVLDAPDGPGAARAARLFLRTGDGPWVRHATARLAPPAPAAEPPAPAGGTAPVTAADPDAHRFRLAPDLLDAGWSAAVRPDGDVPHAVTRLRGVAVLAPGAAAARPAPAPGGGIAFTGPGGEPVARVAEVATGPLPVHRHRTAAVRVGECLFGLDWEPAHLTPAPGRSVAPAGAVPRADVLVVEPAGCAAVLDALRAVLADPVAAGSAVVVRTEGAVAAGPGDRVTDPDRAAVCGLVRSAAREHPGRLVLVDGPADLAPDDLTPDDLAAAAASGEPQLARRGGRWLVPRLVRTAPGAPTRWERGGTVLVTGGTGALGRRVARHLAGRHGVRRLLLTGRRGPAGPGAAELVAELAGLGCAAEVVACDVGDRAALAALLAAVPADRPLTAVVHAAGVVEDGVLTGLDAARLERVLRVKAGAARAVHDLTRGLDLDRFVLFSAFIGLVGGPGQAAYAAANAVLDALAEHRRSLGLPATAVAWGLWAGDGMGAALGDADRRRMARSGVVPLDPDAALELFDHACGADRALVAAARLRLDDGVDPLPVLDRLRPRPPAGPAAPAAPATPAPDLRGLDADQRVAAVLRAVRAEAAAVLGHPDGERVAPTTGFLDQGFDSLTAVELRHRLVALTGHDLPATAVFDHPSPRALAEHLAREVLPAAAGAGLAARVDALAAEVAGAELDGAGRTALAERLRALLDRLGNDPDGDPDGDVGGGAGGRPADALLADATDDEIFDFIDNELGAS